MNKSFIIAAAVIALVIGTIFYLSNNNSDKGAVQNQDSTRSLTPQPTVTVTPTNDEKNDTINSMDENQQNELIVEDLKVGSGAEATAGKKVTVNYKGTLSSGVQFDSSYDRGTPFTFSLGAGEVIKGWDVGVAGMKVGGKRKLTIPPSLGYGARSIGEIPANSTLIFEVELLKVE